MLTRYRIMTRRRLVLVLLLGLLLFLAVVPAQPVNAAPHVSTLAHTHNTPERYQQPQDGVCSLSIFGFQFDICKTMQESFIATFTTLLVKAAVNLNQMANDLYNNAVISVWVTDGGQTYRDKTVVDYHQTCLVLADMLLILAILWSCIKITLVGWGNWLIYAKFVDILPRLFLGFLAAHFSLSLMQLLIDGNNAISQAITINNPVGVSFLDAESYVNDRNMLVLFFTIFYDIMSFLLLLELFIRDALINILIILSPLWMLLWTTRETQFIARRCMAAAVAVIFTQAIQSIIVTFGGALILNLAYTGESVVVKLFHLFGAIAVLGVALSVPALTQKIAAPSDGGLSKVAGAIGSIISLA